ncbi:hypothetical protein pb186bvf_002501 [Paramecium bursaria]
MPREIHDVKSFLNLIKGPEVKDQDASKEQKRNVYIKETKKITKFKFRGPRFLYTFKTNDKNKAAKILQTFPSNVSKIQLGKKKLQNKKKPKK